MDREHEPVIGGEGQQPAVAGGEPHLTRSGVRAAGRRLTGGGFIHPGSSLQDAGVRPRRWRYNPGCGKERVSTTWKSRPLRRSSSCSAESFQRRSGAPEMYHGEPLSARIIP